MANEIKFIFTGDTSDYDKAINDIIKKANKAADATKKQTESQKAQLKLQKLVNAEFEKAAKTGSSVLKIQKLINTTEKERLSLSKKLNDSSLTRKKRLETIVDLAKKEAKLAGLNVAKTGRRGMAAGGVAAQAGTAALGKVGLGGAGSVGTAAGAGAVALGATAATATGIGLAVAAVAIPLIIAFKALTSVIKGTKEAMANSMALEKTSQISKKSIERVQAESLAGKFGGDASDPRQRQLFKDLGLIIDKELVRSLAESGKKIRAVAIKITNLLMPVFEKLAKVVADAVVFIGGTVSGFMMAMGPVWAYIKEAPFNPGGAIMQFDWTTFAVAQEQFKKQMQQQMKIGFKSNDFAGRMKATDDLARIGLFKGGKDSMEHTLKASLATQRLIESNTGERLRTAIENA